MLKQNTLSQETLKISKNHKYQYLLLQNSWAYWKLWADRTKTLDFGSNHKQKTKTVDDFSSYSAIFG